MALIKGSGNGVLHLALGCTCIDLAWGCEFQDACHGIKHRVVADFTQIKRNNAHCENGGKYIRMMINQRAEEKGTSSVPGTLSLEVAFTWKQGDVGSTLEINLSVTS